MHAEFEIKPLEGISAESLYKTFCEAFKDYRFQWDFNAFNTMITRRGFRPEYSFGAFDKDTLVSFTLNGVGNFDGKKSAYDTSTGTIEEYRGKGLASAIFQFSLPYLKQLGVRQYILEVLEENATARSVYEKQGFVISRKLECFRISKDNFKQVKGLSDVTIKEASFSQKSIMEAMQDFNPSWQNNFKALIKTPGHFSIIGAYENDRLTGFGIIDKLSGDIPQLAVEKSMRKKGIGGFLLSELMSRTDSSSIRVANIPDDQTNITSFLKAKGFENFVNQFEMKMNLQG